MKIFSIILRFLIIGIWFIPFMWTFGFFLYFIMFGFEEALEFCQEITNGIFWGDY